MSQRTNGEIGPLHRFEATDDKQVIAVFTGRETVLNAVANAGFTDREWPATVYLFRPASARQRSHTVTIDMRPVCTTGDFRSNYLIEEGDVLFVPPGPRIAWNPKLLHQILAW